MDLPRWHVLISCRYACSWFKGFGGEAKRAGTRYASFRTTAFQCTSTSSIPIRHTISSWWHVTCTALLISAPWWLPSLPVSLSTAPRHSAARCVQNRKFDSVSGTSLWSCAERRSTSGGKISAGKRRFVAVYPETSRTTWRVDVCQVISWPTNFVEINDCSFRSLRVFSSPTFNGGFIRART